MKKFWFTVTCEEIGEALSALQAAGFEIDRRWGRAPKYQGARVAVEADSADDGKRRLQEVVPGGCTVREAELDA